MLQYIREDIMDADFTDAMQSLQRFPQEIDVRIILNGANQFVKDDPLYQNYARDHY